jgi:SAM-dependent methyltransferase
MMRNTESIGPRFPDNAFAGTAAYYVRYRLPYPEILLKDLMDRSGAPGPSRLLDLACGPGRLTLRLAPFFSEVWAVDLEPEMIEAARHQADRLGVTNIQWKVGRAEELDAPPGSFGLITMGEAFHRLDQPRVAAGAFRWLRPGCCIASVGSYSIFGGGEPWQRIVLQVVRRWSNRLSPDTGAKTQGTERGGPNDQERVLREAGFVEVSRPVFFVPYEWTVDSILGFLYSTSVSSKAVLGKNVKSFEEDLRSTLLAHDPAGIYRETMQWGYTLARKPT